MKPVKKVFIYKRKSCVSLYVSCVLSLALNAENCKLYDVVSKRLCGGFSSLRASSLFGGYREKWTHERHARGDAKAGSGERKASRPLAASPLARAFSCGSLRSCVLVRLASLAQTGELARRLQFCETPL